MPNFTPGPWKVGEKEDFYGGRTILVKTGSGVALTTGIPDDEKDKANAHLIAAAPEMYSILKELFSILEGAQPWWYLRKHYNAITNALAKAEGKQKTGD